MIYKDLLVIAMAATFLQILHCFEEIGMNAYVLLKRRFPKNPRGAYLRVASLLVGLNFAVLWSLVYGVPFAPYLCLYTVFISLINTIIHIVGWIKAKSYMGTLGAGIFSGIPLGIAGGVLLYVLIAAYLIP